jgi:hypothetical protein
MGMTSILRQLKFEFTLIRTLFFRVVFERLTNTLMAACAGFAAVYFKSHADFGELRLDTSLADTSLIQGMVLFAYLYAETIMANWQYATNRIGRMELIFNSTQPPLQIIFIKVLASSVVTLGSLIVLYALPLAWFGRLGAFNASFWLVAGATLLVCAAVMSFNAVFEFQVKQIKALTSLLNMVFPYLALTYASRLPYQADLLPYFNVVHFLNLNGRFGWGDVVWLYATAAIASLVFLGLAQLVVRRIRSTASVYAD